MRFTALEQVVVVLDRLMLMGVRAMYLYDRRNVFYARFEVLSVGEFVEPKLNLIVSYTHQFFWR